jgi:hypothetical protein
LALGESDLRFDALILTPFGVTPDRELRKVPENMSTSQARYGFGESRLATASQCKRTSWPESTVYKQVTLACTNHGNLVTLVDILTAYTSQLLGQRFLSRDIGFSLDLDVNSHLSFGVNASS